MISYSNLGKKGHGNLGNQLFQIASCIGLAETFGEQVVFPEWKYEKYFVNPLPHGVNKAPHIHEVNYHYDLVQFNGHSDISGWLQSEKYFEHCREKVKEQFRFKEYVAPKDYIDNGRTNIAISVRRGDYVNNPNYALLPIKYYLTALTEHFPNYKECNVVIFSDDMDYCRVHFNSLPHVIFNQDLNDIEQLCLMSMCDHFIIANSTFSWWGAWLGEKEHSKIIKPNYLFGREYGKKNNAKDFYPERWTVHDHARKKIDLSDTTFIIPVSYDHPDRKENLSLAIKQLRENFECKIIVGEQGTNEFADGDYVYVKFPYEKFHRTRMLNEMTKIAGTEIVINYDADVVIPPMQIFEAVEKIRNGSDFVYPYDGRFARVPRSWYSSVSSFNDVGVFKGENFKGTFDADTRSWGGCIAYNKDSFFNAGGENEKFVSYCPEDWERAYRFQELGYKVERVRGILYHIDHWCGVNSQPSNPGHAPGMKELRRIQKLKGDALRKEVDSWVWAKNHFVGLKTELVNS